MLVAGFLLESCKLIGWNLEEESVVSENIEHGNG